MAAVLPAAAPPRRRRRPTSLLIGAAVLAALAATLLVLTAVTTGRAELRLRLSLADIKAAAAALPWAAAVQQQQQQRSGERAPPLPDGKPPPRDTDDDPFAHVGPNYHDPYASGGGDAAAAARGGGSAAAGGGSRPIQAPAQPPAEPETQCSEVLGVPKVALLFLTTRRLAHEKLWRLWLWDAAHLLPVQAQKVLQGAVCGPPAAAELTWRRIQQHCRLAPRNVAAAGVTTALPPQHLFSIYVHSPPDYQGLEFQPLFVGRLIPARIRTAWGDMSILDAEKALLREALLDPLNVKFALISDSDVPLYDPLTFYQQLMWEDKSRVRACKRGWMNVDRWRDEMGTPHMRAEHWRKSNQFFGLTRRHAELVVADTEAERSFRNKCGGWYPHLNQWKECIADEHYVPTLLAAAGLEGEGYCEGWGLAYTDWSGGGQHPKSFLPKDVTPALFRTMRWGCENMREAAEDSLRMFAPLEPILSAATAEQACAAAQAAAANSSSSGAYAHPLDGKCPLTARKFPSFTALRVRQLFVSACPDGGAAVPESRASQVFGVQRDPDLVLLRGAACTADVQRQVLYAGGSGVASLPWLSGRRLLCAAARRWGGSVAAQWLSGPGLDCDL